MTTPIVPSITDEQLADLEAFASDSKLNIYRPMGWAHSVRCGNHLQTDHEYLSAVSPDVMLALIARLRAAEKDAARYRFLCDPGDADEDCLAHAINTLNAWADKSEIDQAVDAAMEQSK